MNGNITDEAVKGATIVGTDATGKIIPVATSSLGITGYWNKSGNTISNTVDNASTTNLKVSGLADISSALVGTIQNTGPYLDSSFNSGTSGQVLTSTVNGTLWQKSASTAWSVSGATTTNSVANVASTNGVFGSVNATTSGNLSTSMNYTINGINAITYKNRINGWYLAGASTTPSPNSILIGNGVGNYLALTGDGANNSLITGVQAAYGQHSQDISNNFAVHETIYGNQAGYNILESGGDTLLGYRSGYNLDVSGGNILLGGYSGYNIFDSGGNIVLGNGVGIPTDTNSHLNIGNVIYGTGMYSGYQYETDTFSTSNTPTGGFIGIGTSSPIATLSVKGTAGSLPFVLSSSTDQVMFEVAQSGDECHWNTVTSKWWVYQYATSSPTLVPVASSTCF